MIINLLLRLPFDRYIIVTVRCHIFFSQCDKTRVLRCKDKNRVYYEFYHLDGTENVPEDYKEISFVCLRLDGSLELPSTLGIVCRKIAQKLDGFEGFHFHQLRHTYTSNLLANGAAPKDVQELLGHSDVSTI